MASDKECFVNIPVNIPNFSVKQKFTILCFQANFSALSLKVKNLSIRELIALPADLEEKKAAESVQVFQSLHENILKGGLIQRLFQKSEGQHLKNLIYKFLVIRKENNNAVPIPAANGL